MIINMNATATTQQSTKYALTLSTSSNANVIISKDSNNFVGVTNSDGLIVFNNLEAGIWTINISKGSLSVTKDIDIQEDTISNITLNSVPEFTYKTSSGANAKYEIYNASGVNITNNPETQGDWKIKFLESGILTLNRLNGAADGIDVFCVGGGGNGANYNANLAVPGGGGGGGYTTTKKGVSVQTGKYTMSVGGSGGTTYAFKGTAIEVSAKNGSNGYMYKGASTTDGNGGNGGSGGGGIFASGGSDGYDGSKGGGQSSYAYGGKGQRSLNQGTTTKEFGESTGTLYAGGGGGGGSGAGGYPAGSGGAGGGGKGGGRGAAAENGTPNTGGGGGGGGWAWGAGDAPGKGGSGIVIIRNKR